MGSSYSISSVDQEKFVRENYERIAKNVSELNRYSTNQIKMKLREEYHSNGRKGTSSKEKNEFIIDKEWNEMFKKC